MVMPSATLPLFGSLISERSRLNPPRISHAFDSSRTPGILTRSPSFGVAGFEHPGRLRMY